MKSARSWLVAGAALMLVGLSACGGDSEGNPASAGGGGADAEAGKGAQSTTQGGTGNAQGGGSGAGQSSGPPPGDGGGDQGNAAGQGNSAGALGDGGAAADACGGCDSAMPICVYQVGGPGPSHFTCAARNPCGAAAACSCVVDQGTCEPNLMGDPPGYCLCYNGLQ